MRRLHVASAVDARAASRFADEIDDQLPDARLAVGGEPNEEALLLLVGGEAADELVGDGGNGVIPAEPLIERFVLRAAEAAKKPAVSVARIQAVRIVVMGIPFGSANESRKQVRATRSGVSRGCCVMREA
jgi:hypothetical protein